MKLKQDSLGFLEVPDYVFYGIQLQRAFLNFQISGMLDC